MWTLRRSYERRCFIHGKSRQDKWIIRVKEMTWREQLGDERLRGKDLEEVLVQGGLIILISCIIG